MPSYFEARRVSPEMYENYILPEYLTAELPEKKDAAILDIGCGFGQTLKSLKRMSYTNIYGIDIDEAAVKHCTEEGLSVSLIKDLSAYFQKSAKKFDLIIMQHIVEHLKKEDIIPTLSLIREKALNTGGRLFISTPNAQSAINSYWAFEDFTHNYIFTSGSIYYVLYMSGFKDIRFLDIKATSNLSPLKKLIRRVSYKTYEFIDLMKNKLMASFYHEPNERIYSWELKVIAKNE